MRARLTLHFSDAPVRQLYLDDTREYTMGRSPANDIVMDNVSISRNHARLSFANNAWTVKDLQSKNGIAIDGQGVEQQTLNSDVWISFGELLAHFELRTDEQAAADQQRQRRRHETSLLLRRSISPSAGAEPLLKKLLASVIQLSGMDRGFAMLARPDGEMEIVSTIGVDDPKAFSGSVGAINHALETRSSVVSMEVQQFAPLADRASIITGNIRALVCLPMTIAERTIGTIYADSCETAKILTDLDFDILEGLIGHATTALALAQLDRELVNINGILKDGTSEEEQINRLRESLPAYQNPIAGAAHFDPDAKSRVTWSRVANSN